MQTLTDSQVNSTDSPRAVPTTGGRTLGTATSVGGAGAVVWFSVFYPNPLKYTDPDGNADRMGVDLNLYSPDELIHYPQAKTVPHPENTFIVGGHGNMFRIADDRNRGISFDLRSNRYSYTGVRNLLSAQDLAKMITEPGSGYKKGDTIILLACETGKDTGIETVPNFAQDLADILGPGTIVKAPVGNVSVLEAGKVYLTDDMRVTDKDYSQFRTFIGRDLNDGN
jgi:hypothetical protein